MGDGSGSLFVMGYERDIRVFSTKLLLWTLNTYPICTVPVLFRLKFLHDKSYYSFYVRTHELMDQNFWSVGVLPPSYLHICTSDPRRGPPS